MNVTVLIKTFLRPDACVASVRSWLSVVPGVPIVVVDDGGDVSPDLTAFPSVRHIRTAFDVGVSAGRNVGLDAIDTRYLILADDDNGCTPDSNLPAAMTQLQENDVGILGVGAYWFRDTDGVLWLPGRKRVDAFTPCDATLNHFLADRERMPRWDAALKMAGEHVDYFLECRRVGVRVGATPHLKYFRTRHACRTASKDYGRFRRRS